MCIASNSTLGTVYPYSLALQRPKSALSNILLHGIRICPCRAVILSRSSTTLDEWQSTSVAVGASTDCKFVMISGPTVQYQPLYLDFFFDCGMNI